MPDQSPSSSGIPSGRSSPTSSDSTAQSVKQKDATEDEGETYHMDEFGGPAGNLFIIVFSHFLIYYIWEAIQFYDGYFLWPYWQYSAESGVFGLLAQFVSNIYTDAWPSWYAIKVYLLFLIFEAVLALVNPVGVQVYGFPLAHLKNKKLLYHCNALSCWYVTLVLSVMCYYFEWIDFNRIVSEEYGAFLTVSCLTGNAVSFAIYYGAVWTGQAHRMSGNFVYDFFMGAWLNPRLGTLDLKMFAEIRISWVLLYFITFCCAVALYQKLGYVPGGMIVLLLAHLLYTNACQKGEECVPTTWDIFYEKWGWMIIFWNFCGVPFVYTAQSLYVLKYYERGEAYGSVYFFILGLALCAAYYVFDTCNSQKSRFKMKLRGTYIKRQWAFPQLPWGTLEDPKYIKSEKGYILVDGWYKYARKIHYTADISMALIWGLACGFDSFLPFYYVVFFASFLTHRVYRDQARCHAKYGKDWEKYCKEVPYVFIPGIF